MTKFTYKIVLLALIATCMILSTNAKASENSPNEGASLKRIIRQASSLPIVEDEIDNKLIPYEPMLSQREKQRRLTNSISPDDMVRNLGREQEFLQQPNNQGKVYKHSFPILEVDASKQSPDVPNQDRIKSIAFNSREVRLVGPDQKEVEMKDDVATKLVVALENLQKEATEVWGTVNEKLDKGWGTVNEKLDKGWTDLKAMVEKAVAPEKKSG